jgi:hypothetical protein
MKLRLTQRRPAFLLLASLVLTLGAVALGLGIVSAGHLRGEYDEVNGPGRLVFRGGRVYVTTTLGMTFATTYELDGERVIVKGAAGSKVYTRRGDTLDAGGGVKFVRKE